MESIATGAAADPEAPPHTIQLPEIDEPASSSRGPICNWPILDLLPNINNGNKVQYNRKCKPLYLAALKGDWEEARGLIEGDPSMVRTAITEGSETALHVATKAQQTDFVLKIMEHMNEQDLTLQNLRGDTAFCLAVATGNIQLVEVMRNRNPDLATLTGSWNITPLYLAVLLGKEKMAWFLYDHTIEYLTAEERARIFIQSIKTDLYDIAFRLFMDANELAVTRGMDDDTALHMLAESLHLYSLKRKKKKKKKRKKKKTRSATQQSRLAAASGDQR